MSMRHLAILLLLAGCQYDYDQLYEPAPSDADGGVDVDEGGASVRLIDLWKSQNVDADCRECANRACAEIESACNGDPDCRAFTECVAKKPDPEGQAACRARFAAWVGSEPVRERDLGGPFAQCVFRNSCADACSGNDDLECMGKYAWPLTSGEVPLHMFLVRSDDPTKPFANVRVQVCEARTQCEKPHDEAVSDARGLVELRLPTSYARAFAGYLKLEGEGLYPTLLKFGWNVAQESTPVVISVERSTFELAIQQTGVMPNLALGMLQLRMYGCNGVPQQGIRFTADRQTPQSRSWYLNPYPDAMARATGPIGAGGIIDIPEGDTVVRAIRVRDDRTVAETTAPVRPGYLSVVVFAPLAQ